MGVQCRITSAVCRLIQIRAIKQCQTGDQPVNAVSLLCLLDLMTNTRLKQQTTDPYENASAWEPTMFRRCIMPEAFPNSQVLQILAQSLKVIRCEASCIA